jgi:hypothetical protein
MTYHISRFQNSSGQNLVTANPAAQRDTYFIPSGGSQKPAYNVEINTNTAEKITYDKAFPQATFIYTGTYAYCFWDTGQSQIAGVTQQDQDSVLLIYSGGAGDLVLTVQSNGTIAFSRAPED